MKSKLILTAAVLSAMAGGGASLTLLKILQNGIKIRIMQGMGQIL